MRVSFDTAVVQGKADAHAYLFPRLNETKPFDTWLVEMYESGPQEAEWLVKKRRLGGPCV